MVAVIVNHAYVGGAAAQLKTTIDAAEALQAFANEVRGNVQAHAHRHRGRGIEHVVVSRHLQVEIAQVLAPIVHLKVRRVLVMGAINAAAQNSEIRTFTHAIGHGPAGQARQKTPQAIIVMA